MTSPIVTWLLTLISGAVGGNIGGVGGSQLLGALGGLQSLGQIGNIAASGVVGALLPIIIAS